MSKKVKCELCPTECVLENYQVGGCKVRINKDGILYSLVYGNPCAVAIDPIEKKPFYHVVPGGRAFSVATAGCVLGCKFCQNWQISQARPEETRNYYLPPEDLVRQALFYGCETVAYTYTEPTVFYEYMYDTAVLGRKFGLLNTVHTCGYINRRPLVELLKYIDAMAVDLKAFTEDFYARLCGGRLKPVLETIEVVRQEGVWLEIINLIIPGQNDSPEQIRQMCRWIVKTVGADVPLHFSRFFPYYKMKNLPPTPYKSLWRAREIALEEGMKFVYIGNIRTEAENTFCPTCKRLLIERRGYLIIQNHIKKSRCPFCETLIPGVWEA
jgi:pyruvate formate lyase activating enzyme